MAQEQIELEFADMMQQVQVLQQQAQMNPQNMQVQQQLQKINMDMEARKAVLIAESMADFMKEEKEITSQFDSDPLLKLKSREVDLRAMENQRKAEADEEKFNIDRAKLVQAKEISDDKLEQNEDLAELRSQTSIVKQQMSNSFKKDSK